MERPPDGVSCLPCGADAGSAVMQPLDTGVPERGVQAGKHAIRVNSQAAV
ncbi:hypothetical protein [Paenibacillus tianjinensis]|uniref:Uncharacterized protein n=1 Tax=Paenibacillus tianjinensis TaxID=2810347 RepID=A0ABX7LCB7_9BACL|nr:hypothetical protein [Paenibacillus tianjinensis]QSF45789.1 hypothetical protein JRJ22_03895 [Paenibacillus tianjinensis]